MIKILLLKYGESTLDKKSFLSIWDADIVGSLDKTGRIVKIVKSRNAKIGEKISIGQFCSLLNR
jgi:hypothetical protein